MKHAISMILLFCAPSVLFAQNFNELAQRCAPEIHPATLQALVRVESTFNPFAIGVVKGYLKRQPQNLQEAQQAIKVLRASGKDFSVGLAQINQKNFQWLGLDDATVFDVCKNLKAGQTVLKDCFTRATNQSATAQEALQKAFSCYYSGNFRFGFTQDFKNQDSYVKKVVDSARLNHDNQTIKVPAINTAAPIAVKPSANKKRKVAQRVKKSIEKSKPAHAWDAFNEFNEF